MVFPNVDTRCPQSFLDALAAELAGERVGLVQDGVGSHGAKALVWPEAIVPLLPLSSYSPELDPVELAFRHLRALVESHLRGSGPAGGGHH